MTGVERIAAERQRQMENEGFTAERDRAYEHGELAWVAMHYANPGGDVRDYWPFDWCSSWDKKGKTTRVRDLEKAGALIAAEIDRLLNEARS